MTCVLQGSIYSDIALKVAGPSVDLAPKTTTQKSGTISIAADTAIGFARNTRQRRWHAAGSTIESASASLVIT